MTPPAARLLQAEAPVPLRYSGPILDTHIHLFDPTRPGGVPWPLPGDLIYKSALPARYESLAKPLGVVGAIAIEASPLASDNDWLLRIAEASPVIIGIIGDLDPTAVEFSTELARLRRNPLFLGIRHGNLWDRNLGADLSHPGFWSAMEQLSQASLVLESANPDLQLLEALLKVVDRQPSLTVVIDHLPHMQEPSAAEGRRRLSALLTHFGKAPRAFAKISEVPIQANGKPVLDLSIYSARLDQLCDAFGPERLMFGSDWPNSDHVASFPETLGLVQHYLSEKSMYFQERCLIGNSRSAYRWRPRPHDQAQ